MGNWNGREELTEFAPPISAAQHELAFVIPQLFDGYAHDYLGYDNQGDSNRQHATDSLGYRPRWPPSG